MRLSPVAKPLFVAAIAVVAFSYPAQAQLVVQQQSRSNTSAIAAGQLAGTQAIINSANEETRKAVSTALKSAGTAGPGTAPSFYKNPETQELTQAELEKLLKDSDSPQSKAKRLAAKRQFQKDIEKVLALDASGGEDGEPPPPQDLEELQALGVGALGAKALYDATEDLPIDDKVPGAAIDLRRDAQKEAALSFGARGGLAKRNFEIMEKMEGFETTLDQVFNFRGLLVGAPSGLLIEPPIVRESIDSLVVTQNGREAAVADRMYDINKQAKIVTAPRDWRQYLVQAWVSDVPRPPRLLWPKDDKERARWNFWVAQGWRAGIAQAEEMFQANLARLVADFNGMVRYRTLLTQGMISQPFALHEDRGVTGTKTVMRVGDRALRITGPSQFLTGSDLWKPADQ